ncbi:fungal-specific transcription factor domain-containing protein [Mycena sp. CBHHK59/15]|nr:fungal-specific transcription factor domain-containing protein [Mycena sp. CBHHK59/15]
MTQNLDSLVYFFASRLFPFPMSSSNDDEYAAAHHDTKKRRIQRACDACRRRKSRCDGSQDPGDKCSTCQESGLDCTYREGTTKRAPARSYVAALEARLERAEATVRTLRAAAAASPSSAMSPSTLDASSHSPSPPALTTSTTADDSDTPPRGASLALLRHALQSLSRPPPPPHADDLVHTEIARNLERLAVGAAPARRFMGKSSGAVLVKAAIDMKAGYARASGGATGAGAGRSRSRSASGAEDEASGWEGAWTSRRLQYWNFKPWEQPPSPASGRTAYTFPPAPLLFSLIALYFEHTNAYLPLLHRPSFERDVREGRHERRGEEGFGGTVLMVCAVGSRWSDDPRVVGAGLGPGASGYNAAAGGYGAAASAGYGAASGGYGAASSGYGAASGGYSAAAGGYSTPMNVNANAGGYTAAPANANGYSTGASAGGYSADGYSSNASGYSTAPANGYNSSGGGHGMGKLACGWEWFDQVPLVGKHLFGQATLYDLQYYCLAVQFLDGSSAPQACWTLIGVGLRLALDVGAHRRKHTVEAPARDAELWKRAFWVLVYMDRFVSAGMGRPCAIQYDDFDVDPPLEVDDEYWEDAARPFEQPPGVPSRVAFFNCLLRLNHILGFSLKLLYSLNKTKVVLAIDDAWEEHIVAELDSVLNRWRDEVPEHPSVVLPPIVRPLRLVNATYLVELNLPLQTQLRWDPNRADPLFFDQSVALHCSYYHLQILIHRPFIPMVRKSAPTALPSLAICTSAARACANVVDIQRQRKGRVPVVLNLPAVFTSGIVLLLNVWSGKRTGLVPDPSREIANVHKCMEVVRVCEERWQSAGLLWDILFELASVGQLPLPDPAASPGGTSVDSQQQQQQQPHQQQRTPHPSATPPPIRPKPKAATLGPLNKGARYPRCHIDPMPAADTARILLGAHGLKQTFERPVGDVQFRAPYANAQQQQQQTFAGAMEPSAFAPPPPPDTWFPPEDPFAVAGAAQFGGGGADDAMTLIDSDTIAMWTNAPTGFEVDDWGMYFSNFSEITQQAELGMNMTGQ